MMPITHDPATAAEVGAAFDAYEAALIANDVARLQDFFWGSPDAVRFGVNEQLYGADAINAFRQARVVDFCDRRGLRLSITPLGPDVASVMYEFTSKVHGLERHGRQSQVWARIDQGWKIVAAHVSLAASSTSAGPDWIAFLKQSSAAQRLAIDPAHQPGVIHNLEVLARLAGPLMAFELPEHTEPAPVFVP